MLYKKNKKIKNHRAIDKITKAEKHNILYSQSFQLVHRDKNHCSLDDKFCCQ